MGSEWILGRLDSTGSGQGPVAGCCECGDEPSGSCATELVSYCNSPLTGTSMSDYSTLHELSFVYYNNNNKNNNDNST
jgi:hypothetical protein